MELFEWTQYYIKFKDCMKKQIVEMKPEGSILHVTEKKRSLNYIIETKLEEGVKYLGEKGQQFIVTLNTKENYDYLIDHWKELVMHKELTLLFVHISSNETWTIHPYTHNNVVEEATLKEGLQTLHQSIARS